MTPHICRAARLLLAGMAGIIAQTLEAQTVAAGTEAVQADTIVVTNSRTAPWAVRNNLLYDAALTPNIAFDLRTSRHTSLGIMAGYRPWPTDDNVSTKWRHLLVMPEFRHWNDSTFGDNTWFQGINAVWSHYNAANLGFPVATLYPAVKDERRQGDLLAIGASIGHSWRISRLFRIEAEAGLDIGYTWGDRYECGHCGTKLGDYDNIFLLPKLALNIVLNPRRTTTTQLVKPLPPTPPTPPVLAFHLLPPATVSDLLATDNPVLEEYANYRPYDRTRVLRKEKGMLYVHFPLDKWELRHDFRDNGPTLDRIVDITRQIMADSMSNVRLIQIIGLASVEGTVPHNEDLSANRAAALRDYIKQHIPEATDQLFELNAGGEAWAELRDQLQDAIGEENSSLFTLHSSLKEALEIIDAEPDLARREQRLRRLNGGHTYAYIRDRLLPDQRNSGYLRIYFDRVPDRRAQAINDATQLMQQQRYAEALNILNNVREDARAWNALAVCLYMDRQYDQALSYFRQAADNGNADAAENYKGLSAYLKHLRQYEQAKAKYSADYPQ